MGLAMRRHRDGAAPVMWRQRAGYGAGVTGLWPGGCPAMGWLSGGYGAVRGRHIWCAMECTPGVRLSKTLSPRTSPNSRLSCRKPVDNLSKTVVNTLGCSCLSCWKYEFRAEGSICFTILDSGTKDSEQRDTPHCKGSQSVASPVATLSQHCRL